MVLLSAALGFVAGLGIGLGGMVWLILSEPDNDAERMVSALKKQAEALG